MRAAARYGSGTGLALSALLLYSTSLRAPFTAFAPVIGDVSADLGLTAAAAGLLTGVPVLCFAVATPLSAAFVGRVGTAAAVTASLLGVLAGTVLRSAGGFAAALAGTIVIGTAITIGNVAVPVVVARDFSSGIAGVTGATAAMMNVGSVVTTIGMAPLAGLVGWRWALLSWALVVVASLAVWWRAYGGSTRRRDDQAGDRHDEPHDERPGVAVAGGGDARLPVLRRPLTWLLAGMFALQAASYFGLTAWLPTILHDDAGLSRDGAGAAASLFQGFGIVGGLLAPVALARVHPRAVTLGIAAMWLAVPVGLLTAPGAWPVWTSLSGTAQSANYVVLFSLISTVAGSPAAAGRMSAVVQTCGYALAGVSPTILGALHTASDGWHVPLAVVGVALVVMGVAHTVGIGALPHPRAMRRAAAAPPPPDGARGA